MCKNALRSCFPKLGRARLNVTTAIDIAGTEGRVCVVTGDGAADCTFDGRPFRWRGEVARIALGGIVREAVEIRDDTHHFSSPRGYGVLCELDRHGEAQCDAQAWEGRFVDLTAGRYDGCALRDDGRVLCRLLNDPNAKPVPSGPARAFVRVVAGDDFVCALDAAGAVACWGDRAPANAPPPETALTSLSAGHGHACGLTRTGHARCWGDNSHHRFPPSQVVLRAVVAIDDRTCGLTPGGAVLCWGVSSSSAGSAVRPGH
ncbi:MAG TPA: RCC1 domain-containing protein [Polyangiales bacterium]